MKKFTFALISLLALSITVKAQQYVSTEPANRNVILEEFTGRNCGYCTDGHRIANQIMAANPGRVWAINVHSGGYAPTSYPNFNTSVSASILGGFSVDGFPSGVVNRSTSAGQNRSAWSGLATQQLAQASECNVAGVARINPETRVATITVEVYYTGNSTANENYLTVAMLQDSILGSQSDYGNYNPTQWLNGQYVHMHVLRDIVTPTWGEAISPTTAGTLVTKTYEYQIPEVIGNPNGVDVVLDHIIFLAWVAERYQGTPTRPILTACELEKTTLTDQPIYPSILSTEQVLEASCSHVKSFRYELANIGTETITSMKYTAEVEGSSQDYEWTGELASGDKTKLEFDLEIPFGTFVGTLNITEVNGEAYERSFEFAAECYEWAEVEIEEETTNVKLYIIQDQFGEQITWNIINSTGAVVASGGPYQHLMGSGSTQPNVENINNLPADECYLFRIFDSNGNGICCNYGEGYYYIKDAAGNRIIEGDGDFGSMASHLFSINKKPDMTGDISASGLVIYPNPANNKIYVDGEDVSVVEIYNSLGQRVLVVEGSEKTSVDVAAFGNGVYVVRAITNEGNVVTKKVTIAH